MVRISAIVAGIIMATNVSDIMELDVNVSLAIQVKQVYANLVHVQCAPFSKHLSK
jgi:hypothetical protein